MSPRSYQLGRRRASSEQTRSRILAAARALIIEGSGFSGFSVDEVARKAGVARMTVYYQFGSKRGLLEALFDELAGRGLVERLPAAFAKAEPLEAFRAFVVAFAHFWASDREVLRRIRALAALDSVFGEAVRARDERRRDGLGVLVRRLAESSHRLPAGTFDEMVDILFTLTSFETFDSLAGTARSPDEIEPLIRRLAFSAIGLGEGSC